MELFKKWHANYADQLLELEWFNTLSNVIANVYAPVVNGQVMLLTKRLKYLKADIDYCLSKLNLNPLNMSQVKFINQVQECIKNKDGSSLYRKYI